MYQLVIASSNPHKINEIKYFFKDLPIKFLVINDFPEMSPIIEDGKTFTKNAVKKALDVFKYTGLLSLGDDSGLEVDTLHGEPGVISARYFGENATDEANNQKLLDRLKNVPAEKRSASFQCVLAFYPVILSEAKNLPHENHKPKIFRGTCPGKIIFSPRGNLGFGYDPLFVPNGFNKTFAELEMTEKLKISHRAKALLALKDYLFPLIKGG